MYWSTICASLILLIPLVYAQTTGESSNDNVDVVCQSSRMLIYVNRSMVGGYTLQPTDGHLRDPKCTGYARGDSIAFYTSYSRCQTHQEQVEDYIVYSNVLYISYTEPVPGTNITRATGDMQIEVRCQFDRRPTLNKVINTLNNTLAVSEAGFGDFSYSFRQYFDGRFFRIKSNDEEPVSLGDPLFYGVIMYGPANLTLSADRCWATPTSDPMSTPQYDIIRERCVVDDTAYIQPKRGYNFVGFSFQAFTFIGHNSQMYLHCQVVVCKRGDPESVCAQGCVPTATVTNATATNTTGSTESVRRRRSASSNSHPQILTQLVGPFKNKEIQGGKPQTQSAWSTRYTYITAAIAGGVVCLVGGMVVMYAVMKIRNTSKRTELQNY